MSRNNAELDLAAVELAIQTSYSMSQAARKLNTSTHHLYFACKRNGIKTRRERREEAQPTADEIKAAVFSFPQRNQVTTSAVAQRLQIGSNTLVRLCKKYKMVTPSKHRRDYIKKRVEDACKTSDTAVIARAIVGMSQTRFSFYCRKYGIETPYQRKVRVKGYKPTGGRRHR